MTMNFNRKTCMRLAAGTVLCGGAAFGGLLWWQLQAFDRMTDSRLERGMGLFALELERRDGGLLQRDLGLRLGFRTEDGLTESLSGYERSLQTGSPAFGQLRARSEFGSGCCDSRQG